MSEMSIRTRSASSYDNYLFPGMIGGLAVLRGMKYLAFKRVLFPSIINQSKKYFKKRTLFHTCPGNVGIFH